MLQTARTKANKSRKQAGRTSSAMSNHSDVSMPDSGKPTNTSTVTNEESRTSAQPGKAVLNNEETKDSKEKPFSSWFARKQLPGAGLQFKFANFENRLIRFILEKQGFKESYQDYGMPAADFYNIANATNCNFLQSNTVVLIWSAYVVKSNIYNNLGRFQRINHFPRSYEITRKDCLYDRYSRMQALYGNKNFNFMPLSYNCPQQNQQLQAEMRKHSSQLWIMKPKASSQGKGIQVISSFDEVPRGAGQPPCLV